MNRNLQKSAGRRGGLAQTRRKTQAARQNALLRWHPRDPEGVIPPEALIDGAWYRGTGRLGVVACWDETSRTFWTVRFNTWVDPKRYPAGGTTRRLLKSSSHDRDGGCFSPVELISAE